MTISPASRNRFRARAQHAGCAPFLMLAAASVVSGAPPIEPLPPPDYSFDLASTAVREGTVDAADVLVLDFPDPNAVLTGDMLGLLSPEDDLDALSGANALVSPQDTFALLFSVSADSLGAAPPDPVLIGLHVPYNVFQQAGLGHAAGDQFMSTVVITRSGAVSGTVSNSVLTRNNYDEGGTDFCALPPTSADRAAWDDSLDIVDAMDWLTRVHGLVTNVYFSVSADSPSLNTLPTYGSPSGADIYVNELPQTYAPTTLYAANEHMQLVQADDIDGLVVFDANQNGRFDGWDQVLFSLAPGSPSLETIPGASPVGAAADVFTVTPGGSPALFVAAAELGLGDPLDDIDALSFFFCDDGLTCAARHGIRSFHGDLDGDGDVDLTDLAQLLAHYGMTCGAAFEDGDLDGDEDVDLADLAALLAAYALASP